MTLHLRLALCALAALVLIGAFTVSSSKDAWPMPPRADLALVLAVDVSASVNDERFRLQRDGIAQALESRAMAEAVGPEGKVVELAVVEWSQSCSLLVAWTVIRGPEQLAAVATALRDLGRPSVGYMTDVGLGISCALDQLTSAPLPADRQVIDVSGDGKQNTGDLPAAQARDLAVARGITINGLPITSGAEPQVDAWYRENVVGGDQAFLEVANGHEDFARAMRQKLTLEVAGAAPSGRSPSPARSGTRTSGTSSRTSSTAASAPASSRRSRPAARSPPTG